MDLRAFLGSDGWADPATAREFLALGAPRAWSFWFFVPDALLWPAYLACLAAVLAFAAGLFSRVTAPLAWIIAVSTARRVPVMLFGFDQIVNLWALYLAVTGASGQAFSADRWLADYRRASGSDDYMLIVASWVDSHADGLEQAARRFREAIDEQIAA